VLVLKEGPSERHDKVTEIPSIVGMGVEIRQVVERFE
jgi:hypothetical protein